MVFLLALAGRPGSSPASSPSAPSRPGVNVVALATGAAIILAPLNFLPALSLGRLAEGLP
ncbi:hypothetical protein ACWCYL_41570 [Streptomyces sp. 900105755]|uniref:hypothetical protein n=1 Tax=Streptomyces sp. 900105755 TaxID=3154389 RepID=UPI00332BFA2E